MKKCLGVTEVGNLDDRKELFYLQQKLTPQGSPSRAFIQTSKPDPERGEC